MSVALSLLKKVPKNIFFDNNMYETLIYLDIKPVAFMFFF